ncbi:MAG: hypothetical protein ACI35W_06430 [Anaeroplasmataceae bacterium]
MSVTRSRIIVNYKNKDFLTLIKNKNNINIVYEGNDKDKYLIIYCDRQDEKYLFETISNDDSVLNAYISNERIDSYNF